MGQRISDIGEFGLIARIRELVSEGSSRVVLGIGDDTAAIDMGGGRLLLLTTDVQIEERHFRRRWMSPRQLGRRSAAINLSDIAAMGGRPTFALLSLALPQDLEVRFFDDVVGGAAGRLADFGASLIGGNLAGADDHLYIDLTLLGEVDHDLILRRDGARPGDAILVTGSPGDSAAGFALLESENRPLRERFRSLVRSHLDPSPRVLEGEALAKSKTVTSMIDISDGLASDLRHLCDAGGVGAEVEEAALPISPRLDEAAVALKRDPLEFVLYGGEAYELLFTVPPDSVQTAVEVVKKTTGVPVSRIGQVVEDGGRRQLLRRSGERLPLSPRGWDHFAAGR